MENKQVDLMILQLDTMIWGTVADKKKHQMTDANANKHQLLVCDYANQRDKRNNKNAPFD